MTNSTKSNKRTLTGEERAKLLAKVYTVILSPEWENDEPSAQRNQDQNNPVEQEETASK